MTGLSAANRLSSAHREFVLGSVMSRTGPAAAPVRKFLDWPTLLTPRVDRPTLPSSAFSTASHTRETRGRTTRLAPRMRSGSAPGSSVMAETTSFVQMAAVPRNAYVRFWGGLYVR